MPAAPAAGAGPWAERAAGLHFCFWFFDLSPVSQQEPFLVGVFFLGVPILYYGFDYLFFRAFAAVVISVVVILFPNLL